MILVEPGPVAGRLISWHLAGMTDDLCDGITAEQTGTYRMRDTQAILAAARLRQHERRQAEALLRRMACIEAALLRNPAAGRKRDRLERDINRLRQEMRRVRAGFASRPLLPRSPG